MLWQNQTSMTRAGGTWHSHKWNCTEWAFREAERGVIVLHVWVGWRRWPADHGRNDREIWPVLPSGLLIMTY